MANKNSASVVRCQRRKKQEAVEYLGGKCSICGYNKCLQSLDFHHVNPADKEFNPSYIIMRWSWEKVKKELDKCLLVCKNCHGEIHFGMYGAEELKRKVLIVVELKCKQCGEIFRTKNKDQLYCGDRCSKIKQRHVDRPTKEQLTCDIDGLSWVAIGRKYGVSDNAVRKWARYYKLLPPKL